MTQTIYPFKVYDSYIGKVLIGFANLNSEIIYDISYDEAIRAEDKGHIYYVRKEKLWYQLDSCNIVPLVEEPNIVPRKSHEPNIILEKDTRILDSTEDFYILTNNFNEETVYNHRNVSIFDPWIHYKEYMINKHSKPIERLEEYLEKLDKLKRNQMLVFLKNINSTDFYYLYNYTKLSKSSLSQKLYKKFENCLAYVAWKFAEEVSENHMFFAYKFFSDDFIQELEKPLNIAKETKGNILESFFVKAEKYKLSHEKTAIFIPIEQEYKQEKTIDDYINFSKEVFSIAEKDGLLAIDSLSQMEDYPFMDELMKMWATGIWKSSSDFFKLYMG